MRRALLAVLLFALPLPPAVADAPQARDAWIRAAPPTARVQSGYLVLANPGPRPIALIGARSAGFGRIEIHDMSMHDGVMRMRRLERLELAPGSETRLEPGGRHLMLFEPLQPLAAGAEVELTLEFEPPVAPLAVTFAVAGKDPHASQEEHEHDAGHAQH